MKLLLVEDDNHVAAALSAVLARHGFDVTHARNGEEALRALVPEGGPVGAGRVLDQQHDGQGEHRERLSRRETGEQ
ncbi:hypothetical protein ACWDAZ_31035, partial [Streptomyces sp. NPDC001215]